MGLSELSDWIMSRSSDARVQTTTPMDAVGAVAATVRRGMLLRTENRTQQLAMTEAGTDPGKQPRWPRWLLQFAYAERDAHVSDSLSWPAVSYRLLSSAVLTGQQSSYAADLVV